MKTVIRRGIETLTAVKFRQTTTCEGNPSGTKGNGHFPSSGWSVVRMAVIALLALSSVSLKAQSITGGWFLQHAGQADSSLVLTVLGDGTFFLAEDGNAALDPTGQDGMERGTYKWNQVEGTISFRVLADTNGEWGTSNIAPTMAASVTGTTLTLSSPAEGTLFCTRVANPSNPIVGSWFLRLPGQSHATRALTFLADGSYFMADDSEVLANPGGQPGMERGTYLWNPVTGAFSAATTVDTTGQWGLSNPGGAVTVTVSGDALTYTDPVKGVVTFSRVAAPANDALANATVLPAALPIFVTGSSEGASTEPGEPLHDNEDTLASVWWRWTPAATGDVIASAAGSSFDAVLAVYQQDAGGALTPVASDSFGAYLNGHSAGIAPFHAMVGTTYAIAVANTPWARSGAVRLSVVSAQNPANDAFAQAALISGTLPQLVAAPTAGLTVEPSEPYPFGGTAWWKWVAPQNGTYKIESNMAVAIYTGTAINSLTPAGDLPYASNSNTLTVTAGQSFYFEGLGQTYSPLLVLQLRQSTPPPNDDFAAASEVQLPSDLPVSLRDATSEDMEPPNETFFYQPKTAWWTYTADANGTVEMQLDEAANTAYQLEFAAFTGTDLENLSTWASSSDLNFLSFPVRAGETYKVRVTVPGFYSPEGEILFRAGPPAPANDAFASATVLNGLPVDVTGSIAGATTEPGESTPDGEGSLWYQWTAATNGKVTLALDTDADTTSATMDVFTGSVLSSLTPLATQTSEVQLQVVAGTTYRIAVHGRYFAEGAGAFTLHLIPPPTNDDFASALALAGAAPLSAQGTNIGAGVEDTEPLPLDAPTLAHTVWWKWTAPGGSFTAAALVSTPGGQQVESRLTVFTGSSLGSLVEEGSGAWGSPISLSTQAAVTYYFRIDSPTVGNVALSIASPPVNDAFASATVLTGVPLAQATGTLLGATPELTEPTGGDQSVWYQWTATSNGTTYVQALLDQQTVPLAIDVFEGSAIAALTPVGSMEQAGLVSFAAVSGTTYRIRVDNASGRVFDPASFHLTLAPAAPNATFATATTLPGSGSTTSTATNFGAFAETGEPLRGVSYVAGLGGHSVWWSWTPSSTDLVVIDTYGSNFDTVLHVYTGSAIDALTLLRASDDARAEGDSRVAFVPTAGVTYHIRVDGRRTGDLGVITLHATTQPAANTPASHLAYGRSYMEGGSAADLDEADQHFAQALVLAPTDPAANALRGVTRMAAMQHASAVTNVLAQWGIQTIRSGLHGPRYDTGRDVSGARTAPAGANTSQATTVAANNIMAALVASDANFATISSPAFALPCTDSEMGRPWASVDYGDIQVLRAIGSALRAAIHMNNTLNTDAPLSTLVDLDNQRKLKAEHILKSLPSLLAPRGTDQRPSFKTAMQEANTRYQEGSAFVRNRTDTADNPHHLFHIGSSRTRSEEVLRNNASGISAALDGHTTWSGQEVNLLPLLTTASSFRALLPTFKNNHGVISSAPDPTFVTSLTPGSQAQVNHILEVNHLLYDISTYASWAADMLGGRAAADQAPDAVLDGDGLSNFTKYAFALDPGHAGTPSAFMNTGLVAGTAPTDKHFAITFIRLKSSANLTYTVTVSDDLVSWDETGAQVEQVGAAIPQPDGASEQVTFRLKNALSGALKKKFLRIKVSAP